MTGITDILRFSSLPCWFCAVLRVMCDVKQETRVGKSEHPLLLASGTERLVEFFDLEETPASVWEWPKFLHLLVIKLWSLLGLLCASPALLCFPGKDVTCLDALDEKVYSLTFHVKIGIITSCFPAVFHLMFHRLCCLGDCMAPEMTEETTSPSYIPLTSCPEYRRCWSIVINSCSNVRRI